MPRKNLPTIIIILATSLLIAAIMIVFNKRIKQIDMQQTHENTEASKK